MDTIRQLINTPGSLAGTFLKGSSPEPSPSTSVVPYAAEITGLWTAERRRKTDAPLRLHGFGIVTFVAAACHSRGLFEQLIVRENFAVTLNNLYGHRV